MEFLICLGEYLRKRVALPILGPSISYPHTYNDWSLTLWEGSLKLEHLSHGLVDVPNVVCIGSNESLAVRPHC